MYESTATAEHGTGTGTAKDAAAEVVSRGLGVTLQKAHYGGVTSGSLRN